MHRLSGEDEETGHLYSPVYLRHRSRSDSDRILATVPGGEVDVVRRLAACLDAPFQLLYVLHTARGEGEVGRYQSPELSREELDAFLTRFESFLRSDGRYDLWVRSAASGATLVWDRHNLLWCYGPIDAFESVLKASGYEPGEPRIPAPHSHHYRPECDADARALLTHFDWYRTDLRPEDEQ